MNESDAIRLCIQDRDPRGFEFLVRKFRREAMMHALAFVQNPEDAADVCQESFTKAFGAFPRVQSMPSFYPWFYVILRNTCLNHLSKLQNLADVESIEDANHGHEPAASLVQNESADYLKACMAELSWKHREILSLKYFGERSYEQMGELLGIPRGTVMSRLYHARKALLAIYDRRLS